MQTTVDSLEVEKFSKIADEWWDANGKFRPLHLMNPVRIAYIRERAVAHFKLDSESMTPLTNLDVLDIGCGGGLLSEPLARIGGDVTAIDASEKNIKTAQAHLAKSGVKVDYRNMTAEALSKTEKKFDIICALEVIEHVSDVKLFLNSCQNMLKPNGIMFISTINRTPKAFAKAIVGAEYVLKLLPKGTHDWKKFLKPSEIDALMGQGKVKLKEMAGISYNPFTEKFKITDDISVNYIMYYG